HKGIWLHQEDAPSRRADNSRRRSRLRSLHAGSRRPYPGLRRRRRRIRRKTPGHLPRRITFFFVPPLPLLYSREGRGELPDSLPTRVLPTRRLGGKILLDPVTATQPTRQCLQSESAAQEQWERESPTRRRLQAMTSGSTISPPK